MKTQTPLFLLLGGTLGTACYFNVQSLSSPELGGDASAPVEGGASANAYGCGWEDVFFAKTKVALPACFDNAIDVYNQDGNLTRSDCDTTSNDRFEQLLGVGTGFGIVRMSSELDNAGERSIWLIPPTYNGAPALHTVPIGSNASVQRGNQFYYGVFPQAAAATLHLFDLGTGTRQETKIFYPTVAFGQVPDEAWLDNVPASAEAALYFRVGLTIWRKPNWTETANVIYQGTRLARDYYVVPNSSDVYTLEAGSQGFRHQNIQTQTAIDERLVAFNEADEVDAYSTMTFDVARQKMVMRSPYRIAETDLHGAPLQIRYQRADAEQKGMLNGTLRMNAAGTEVFFEEKCTRTQGKATTLPTFGTRAMNLATGKVEWLWERAGFPFVEGNARIFQNGTHAYRLVQSESEGGVVAQ